MGATCVTLVQVSPCDGTVLHYGKVTNGLMEQVKGITYSLGEFLGPGISVENSQRDPITGQNVQSKCIHFITIYLAPGDYHHFHSPAQWTGTLLRHFPGTHYTHVCVCACVWVWGVGGRCVCEWMWWVGGCLYGCCIASSVMCYDFNAQYIGPLWNTAVCTQDCCVTVVTMHVHIPLYTGQLLSVAPWVARLFRGLFSVNERVVLSGQWEYGSFTFTAVGAFSVGSIDMKVDKVFWHDACVHVVHVVYAYAFITKAL